MLSLIKVFLKIKPPIKFNLTFTRTKLPPRSQMKDFKATLIIFLLLTTTQSLIAQSFFKEDYPKVWQRAAEYTLKVAAAMPDDNYGFQPTPESMTFQAQLMHLAQNLSFLSGKVSGVSPDFFDGKDPTKLGKEQIGMVLKMAFEYVGKLIEEIEEGKLKEEIEFGGVKMPRENLFYLMRDHATHHRAQAILYLRMNGVEAPDYRGW